MSNLISRKSTQSWVHYAGLSHTHTHTTHANPRSSINGQNVNGIIIALHCRPIGCSFISKIPINNWTAEVTLLVIQPLYIANL